VHTGAASASTIAAVLKVSRATIYRMLADKRTNGFPLAEARARRQQLSLSTENPLPARRLTPRMRTHHLRPIALTGRYLLERNDSRRGSYRPPPLRRRSGDRTTSREQRSATGALGESV
jgi:hypothetical protein